MELQKYGYCRKLEIQKFWTYTCMYVGKHAQVCMYLYTCHVPVCTLLISRPTDFLVYIFEFQHIGITIFFMINLDCSCLIWFVMPWFGIWQIANYDASEFIQGIYIGILPHLMYVEQFGHVAWGHICLWHIYVNIIVKLKLHFVCFVTKMCSNVGFMCRIQ